MLRGEINPNISKFYDINTLDKIERFTRIASIGFLVGYNVLKQMDKSNAIPKNLNINIDLILGEWLGILAACYIAKSIKQIHGKAMNASYNELVENFRKLSRDLGLTDPIEIYELYTTMYNNGYLSYNKKFEFGKTPDVLNNLGSAVINGQGVCRHIAPLLSDILNSEEYYNTKATTAAVYAFSNDLDQEKNDNAESVEKSIGNYNLLLKPIIRLSGNHMITICEHDGKIYAFDPTNTTNLKMHNQEKHILRGYGLDCKLLKSSFVNYRSGVVELFKKSLGDNYYVYSEKDLETLDRTIKIIEDNKDLLEKFYEDNKDIYVDIAAHYNSFARIRR